MGVIRKGVLGIILACSWTVSAQTHVSVSSANDGNGLFSYTFGLGSDSSYVWGLNVDQGNIVIPSHGILDIISPPGWTATVDSNEIISWQPTSSEWAFIGQPSLTFSVQSSSTEAVLYDEPPGDSYPVGGVAGTLFTSSDHQGVAGGIEMFSFFGPQEVPEPSSFALFAYAALIVGTIRKHLTRRAV
jgi:hypothetical protein